MSAVRGPVAAHPEQASLLGLEVCSKEQALSGGASRGL